MTHKMQKPAKSGPVFTVVLISLQYNISNQILAYREPAVNRQSICTGCHFATQNF